MPDPSPARPDRIADPGRTGPRAAGAPPLAGTEPRRPLVNTSAAPRRRRGGAGPVRVLRRVLIAIAAAVAALLLGVGVAYLVSFVGGPQQPSTAAGSSPGSPSPSPAHGSGTSTPKTGAASAVPADWSTAQVAALGLTVRHPPAWVRYRQGRVTLWVHPTQTGGRGVEEVGVGQLSATGTPTATTELEQFGSSFFAGQPGLVVPAATGRASSADLVLTYTRTGVPVRVALHGQSVSGAVRVTLARAAAEPAGSAAALLAQFRAGVSG